MYDKPEYSTPATVMIDARYINGRTSGIGRYTQRLIDALLLLDDQLHLRLITHPENPSPVEHPRVECQTFKAEATSLRTRFLLPRYINTEGVDLFHSPFNILPGNLDIPGVFTLHDIMWLLDVNYCTDSWWRKRVTGTFYRQFIPRSVHQATRVLTVSNTSKEAIEDYFPAMKGRVHTTYNGLDPFFSPMRPEDGWRILNKYFPKPCPFVLVVGQGSPYKNHAGALGGFIEAFRHDPDIYFVLVRRLTRGPAKELKRLMGVPDVASRIIQLDYVSGEELKALYSLAKVFLFPSLYEGFGLPALEAMACGTPVVTSNFGAMSEVCGDAALQVDPKQPKQIAEALTQLVRDPELYARQRQLGLKRAEQFTWLRCARDTLNVYRQILAESAPE